jgi:hypothetical protein
MAIHSFQQQADVVANWLALAAMGEQGLGR